jgi:peptidoglycan hydrolase-like protein with peptidoglycan-binding domain
MSSTSMNRSARRRRLVTSGLCLATMGGLVLSSVPMTASASPMVITSPLSPSIVGLGEGARGNDVKTVQSALIAAGVKVPGGADGVFGPATKSAVTAFQSRSGLPATGTIDEPTAVALGLSQPAASPTASPGALTLGAKGQAVVELQQALMAAGVFVPGGADGVYGQATKTAVSNYQRWNGLPVTGEVDATTSSRLKLGSGATPGSTPAVTPVPAASSNSSLSGMTIGARGENVKVLQRALIAAGITVRGGADGVFGAMTASALTSYQQAKGLAATGVLDEASIASLALAPAATPAPEPTPAPTPTPAASSAYVGLKVGSTGDLVKGLQRALMNTGLVLRGGADGVFGNATGGALIAFQKTNGLPQTGLVGEQEATLLGLGGSTPAATPQGVTSPTGFPVYGERGARVTSLQNSLIAAGISFAGGADGVFGAATAGAIMEFQRRSGITPTGKLDETTASRLGSAPAPAPAPQTPTNVTIDVFPVQGKCWFGDTWQAPRGGGRLHEGVDIVAAKGNLLYAAVTGTISKMYYDYPGALAGNGLRVQADNGTYFTYLHMDTFADGIDVGVAVTAGQVIGTVGNTGNSATAHLHFEVHPGGGAAVNPYPLVKPIDACSITTPRA